MRVGNVEREMEGKNGLTPVLHYRTPALLSNAPREINSFAQPGQPALGWDAASWRKEEGTFPLEVIYLGITRKNLAGKQNLNRDD